MFRNSTLSTMAAMCGLILIGCASPQADAPARAEPETRQLVTGSRLPYKTGGGTESVKTVGKAGVADAMNDRQLPHRQGN